MKKVMMLFLIVAVLVLGVGMSVMAASKEEGNNPISREEYMVLEKECVQEVKQILLEKGCKNAGVTLTYVTDELGNREYTVCIHHEKLEQMKEEEYGLLEERIQDTLSMVLFSKGICKKI